MPFLATTRLLGAAVAGRAGREEAHRRIAAHAAAASTALREGSAARNDLADRVAADPELPLGADVVASALADPARLSGRATQQVDAFVAEVDALKQRYGADVSYKPGEIL